MSKVRAERLVLIIDNDPVLSERLRAVLANYHFKVQLFADGNDLLSGPQLFPELILLCRLIRSGSAGRCAIASRRPRSMARFR
jgi:FixJ family two-component response regulator